MQRSRRFGPAVLAAGFLMTWGAWAVGGDVIDDGPVAAPEVPVAAPRPPVVPPERIPQLVRDLDSDSYRTRQQATELLAEADRRAIAPLAQMARQGSLEAAARAVRVLETFYVSSRPEAVAAASAALEALAVADSRSAADRALQVLGLHAERRMALAVAEIRRLGGIVKYHEETAVIANFPQPAQRPIALVHLGAQWKGDDAGLQLIRRLPDLKVLYVSQSAKRNFSPVSERAVTELQAAMPDLQVAYRGMSCLGVHSQQGTPGCFVSDVAANSAAEKAGVQRHDMIVAFGGQPTRDFETLVDLIKAHDPGDEVEVRVQRDGQLLTLDVVLEEWKP